MRPTQVPLGSHRLPGKARQSSPEARRPVPGQPTRPSRKGWLTDENHCLDRGAGVADRRLPSLGAAGASASVPVDLRVVDRRRWPARRHHASTRRHDDGHDLPARRRLLRTLRQRQSSGQTVDASRAPNMLGVVEEAADGAVASARSACSDATLRAAGLRPRRLQHRRPRRPGLAFWYTEGQPRRRSRWAARQFTIHAGDQLLWYRSPRFPADEELGARRAGAHSRSARRSRCRCCAYADDGTATPGAGAVVSGGGLAGHDRRLRQRHGHLRTGRAPARSRRPGRTTTSRARSLPICVACDLGRRSARPRVAG